MLKLFFCVTLLSSERLYSISSIINHVSINQETLNKQVMRKVSVVLIAVMLLSTGSIFANDVKLDKDKPVKKLSTQVMELLNNDTVDHLYDGATAFVRFTLNQEKEIVVLSVNSEDDTMKSFVKSHLNYKKVNLNEYREGKVYTIPVRIEL